MIDPLSTWRKLAAPEMQPLRDAAAQITPENVNEIAQLRKSYAPELVQAAIDLARAREKAVRKFPQHAQQLIADAMGVEQASSLAVAAHKAKRYAGICPGETVVDLCCGIGGDAIAMTQAGVHVLAVDHNPLRAWMTQQNAHCAAAAADVTTLNLHNQVLHLDPARRTSAGRVWRLSDYQPGLDAITALLRDNLDMGIKLSPGVNLEELPWTGEIEFISEAGKLVQAMLWTGRLAQHSHTATLISPSGEVTTLSGEPDFAPLGDLDQYIFTVDPAVERAGLLCVLADSLGLCSVHPKLGLLTGSAPIVSPWLTGFKLIHQMPWRAKRVRQWLLDQGAGIVEVKTRGKAVDPDHVQKQLRCPGNTPYTVFIHRWDHQLVALITQRV